MCPSAKNVKLAGIGYLIVKARTDTQKVHTEPRRVKLYPYRRREVVAMMSVELIGRSGHGYGWRGQLVLHVALRDVVSLAYPAEVNGECISMIADANGGEGAAGAEVNGIGTGYRR